jgi:hypothetical protein
MKIQIKAMMELAAEPYLLTVSYSSSSSFFFFTVEHVKKKKKRRRPLTATVPQIWWNLRNFNRFSPIIF